MASPNHVWVWGRAILGDSDGLVVVLQVFMDESGTHDGSPVVTVGAYIATPKKWRHWTRDWNTAKAPIKIFHASDCEALVEEFAGWDEVRKNKYVKQLLPVLPHHKLKGLVVGINLNDYNAAMNGRDDLRKLLGTPYTACFHWSISEIMLSIPNNQRVAFVHEVNSFKGEALEAFAAIQKNLKAQNRMFLGFGSKQEYVPLQAADILAFEGNKRLRGPLDRPMRKAWIAIDNDDGESLCRIKYFNRENLPWLVEKLDQVKAYNEWVSAALSGDLSRPPVPKPS